VKPAEIPGGSPSKSAPPPAGHRTALTGATPRRRRRPSRAAGRLRGAPEDDPEPGTETRPPRLAQVAARHVLPERRAGERADENADEAEEEPRHRAERGSDERERARADPLRPERRRGEIDDERERRQEADDDEREPADLREPVDEGPEEEAGEDERRARDRRQDGPRDPGEDEEEGQDPERGVGHGAQDSKGPPLRRGGCGAALTPRRDAV
jgi:hypothetical protein